MNCIPKQRCGNCGTTGNNLPKIHIKINTNVLETAVRSGLSFDLLQEVLPNLQSEIQTKLLQKTNY